jgi:uncharacterized protein (TIGR02265 family)
MLVETVESGVALRGTYDVEAEVRAIPAAYGVKGMFFDRLVQVLGPDFESVSKELEKAPPNGRYVGFRDYPGGDFARLAAACGRKVHPRLGLREAVRRIALDDFRVFAESTIGKVTLAVASGARSILNKVPFIYRSLAPGDWDISAEDLDERTVRLDFRPFVGRWEYAVGQFEGAVLHYTERSVISVYELEAGHIRFDVEHSPAPGARRSSLPSNARTPS